jgi:hypothetical protein
MSLILISAMRIARERKGEKKREKGRELVLGVGVYFP